MATGLNHTGSLNAFYDEIVFHEMVNGRNRFFVTFEKGNFAFPNGKRESIATAEIDYPHVSLQTGSVSAGGQRDHILRRPQQRVTFPRRGYSNRAFLEAEEWRYNTSSRFQNNGHITTTQLKGDRFFKSTLTSSIYKPVDVSYEVHNFTAGTTHFSRRIISGSYYFPHTQYQLGVLRNTPTVTLNLNKKDELPEGMSDKGFVLIPQETNQQLLDNLEYYLEKAGFINKATQMKVKPKPETGGGGNLEGTIAQGMDIYGQQSGYADLEEPDDDYEAPGDGVDKTDQNKKRSFFNQGGPGLSFGRGGRPTPGYPGMGGGFGGLWGGGKPDDPIDG